MSKIAFVLPVAFGVMALGATVGLDFYKKQALAGEDGYSVAKYVEDVKTSFTAQAREAIANRNMADYLGTAAEGWTKRPFEAKDMELLTGKTAPETKDDIPGLSKGDKAMMDLVSASVTRGTQTAGNTFEKDGTVVIVKGVFLPARIMKGFGGKQLGMMADMMNGVGLGTDFAIVRGLKFQEAMNLSNDAPYRRLTASLTPQLQLSVMTNAQEDADVMEVLATLDIASLNQMVVKPIPKMGENDILLLASAEGLANGQPKAKSAALEVIMEEIANAEQEAEKAIAQLAEDTAPISDAEQPLSFADRLSSLLGSGKSSTEEVEKPRRMVCKMQQGFKRCAFPKEE